MDRVQDIQRTSSAHITDAIAVAFGVGDNLRRQYAITVVVIDSDPPQRRLILFRHDSPVVIHVSDRYLVGVGPPWLAMGFEVAKK